VSGQELKEAFIANAEEFDSLMVKMLAENEQLRNELEEAKHQTSQDDWCRTVEHKNLELSAYVERLREALQLIESKAPMGGICGICQRALAESPSTSLKEHDKQVEKEAYKQGIDRCHEQYELGSPNNCGIDVCIKAISALKEGGNG
jgi:bacterioferritin-associated ferredoxin